MNSYIFDIGKLKQERINDLKLYKSYANKVLDANKELKKRNNHSWENSTIENNISVLQKLIADINYDLKNEARIERFCLAQSGDLKYCNEFYDQVYGLSFFNKVSNCTISGSILYDLNWLECINVSDRINVALEINKPNILESYWGEIVEILTRKIIPELQKIHELNDQVALIIDAIKIARADLFTVSNLVIITVIESIVRVIAREIYQKQNPSLQANDVQDHIDSFQSLENLLKKGKWKNDIEISVAIAVLEFGYINEFEINEAKKVFEIRKKLIRKVSKFYEGLQLKSSENKYKNYSKDELWEKFKSTISTKDIEKLDSIQKTNINLMIQLHFLIRRFKEDRNAIVHGKYEGFDSKWKNYIYLSIVEKIYNTIKIYQKIYPIFNSEN
jgi:hypothetical protein